jgi:hypothetical protein
MNKALLNAFAKRLVLEKQFIMDVNGDFLEKEIAPNS